MTVLAMLTGTHASGGACCASQAALSGRTGTELIEFAFSDRNDVVECLGLLSGEAFE